VGIEVQRERVVAVTAALSDWAEIAEAGTCTAFACAISGPGLLPEAPLHAANATVAMPRRTTRFSHADPSSNVHSTAILAELYDESGTSLRFDWVNMCQSMTCPSGTILDSTQVAEDLLRVPRHVDFAVGLAHVPVGADDERLAGVMPMEGHAVRASDGAVGIGDE
jgi:hypothetical protein